MTNTVACVIAHYVICLGFNVSGEGGQEGIITILSLDLHKYIFLHIQNGLNPYSLRIWVLRFLKPRLTKWNIFSISHRVMKLMYCSSCERKLT